MFRREISMIYSSIGGIAPMKSILRRYLTSLALSASARMLRKAHVFRTSNRLHRRVLLSMFDIRYLDAPSLRVWQASLRIKMEATTHVVCCYMITS